MARKPTARAEFVFFNVVYEDGSQRSNRKVPLDAVEDPYDRDKAIREAIEAQDRAISEKSGLPPLAIKAITRAKQTGIARTDATAPIVTAWGGRTLS